MDDTLVRMRMVMESSFDDAPTMGATTTNTAKRCFWKYIRDIGIIYSSYTTFIICNAKFRPYFDSDTT